jgi:hypothetical protein
LKRRSTPRFVEGKSPEKRTARPGIQTDEFTVEDRLFDFKLVRDGSTEGLESRESVAVARDETTIVDHKQKPRPESIVLDLEDAIGWSNGSFRLPAYWTNDGVLPWSPYTTV